MSIAQCVLKLKLPCVGSRFLQESFKIRKNRLKNLDRFLPDYLQDLA